MLRRRRRFPAARSAGTANRHNARHDVQNSRQRNRINTHTHEHWKVVKTHQDKTVLRFR